LLADALWIAALCLYWQARHRDKGEPRARALLRGAACALGIGLTGLLAGAAQLLPSIEYGRDSLRWVGAPEPLPSFEKIPYHLLSSEAALPPGAVLNLVFGGAPVGSSEIAPYFGILPLLLAGIAVRRRWVEALVPFLAVSAGLALFYSLGGYSLLHGLIYGALPLADKAREAGRFVYLSHFCAALLCGYGMDVVFGQNGANQRLEKTARYLNISLFVLLLAAAGAFILHIEIADSTYLSLLFAAGSVAIFQGRGPIARSAGGAALVTVFILCDLYAFYRPIKNHAAETAAGANLLQRVVDAGVLAEFFRSQPGIFRVSTEDQSIRGFGDLYGLDTVNAGAVSVGEAFYRIFTQVPRRLDLLNVRYTVTTQQRAGAPAVFAAAPWFVYEHRGACERAWVSRQLTPVSNLEQARETMQAPSFEPCLHATVLAADLPAAEQGQTGDSIAVVSRRPGFYELAVDSVAAGLLVLSESFAPGWSVQVDGTPRELLRVDGTLQGVWIGPGSSRVVFEYRPTMLYVGLGITLATFALIGVWLLIMTKDGNRQRSHPT
jgi:hypothetical protein